MVSRSVSGPDGRDVGGLSPAPVATSGASGTSGRVVVAGARRIVPGAARTVVVDAVSRDVAGRDGCAPSVTVRSPAVPGSPTLGGGLGLDDVGQCPSSDTPSAARLVGSRSPLTYDAPRRRPSRPSWLDRNAVNPLELPSVHELIARAYKNLEHPDFSFVKKVFSARPYDPLVKRLRDYAVVEECTEAEDDVCFSYFLKGQASLWKLDLSLVGPFGIFVRLRNRVATDDFLYFGKDGITSFETKILDILKPAGIRLMSAEELACQMPMQLYNTKNVRLYQALFSDREALPWEG